MHQQILSWLLRAIVSWSAIVPASDLGRATEVRTQAAEDILLVAYDPLEPPFYTGPYARANTAILIASIAALESRFLERIIRGHCQPYECDGGHAVGLMQVHPGPYGIRLLSNGKAEQCRYTSLVRYDDSCLTIQELAQDEIGQIRAGLHILRTQGFRAFTRHEEMRRQANEWMQRHPPPVTDKDAEVKE
jgi:hypothetical protein